MLYGGKYLIAVYDKDGILIDVFDNAPEMAKKMGTSEQSVYAHLNRIKRGIIKKCETIKLIDVYEKHDDIFKEEDEAFIDFMKEEEKREKESKPTKNYLRKKKVIDDLCK